MLSKYDTKDYINHATSTWIEGGNGHYTGREDMYVHYFQKLMSNFTGGKVLEVGPGDGKFALFLCKNYSVVEYTILDLERNINDSKSFLSKNTDIIFSFIKSKDYFETFDKEYDLFVSNICLSEVPDYYREKIGNNVFSNCKNIFIIDGDKENESFNTWLKLSVDKYFSDVNIEMTDYYDCFAISGSRNRVK